MHTGPAAIMNNYLTSLDQFSSYSLQYIKCYCIQRIHTTSQSSFSPCIRVQVIEDMWDMEQT